MKLILKGGKGSGHRGHAGRPGKVGGGVAGTFSKYGSKVVWEPEAIRGKAVIMRGGEVPSTGPVYLTANPDTAVGYGERRGVGLYSLDMSNILVVGSRNFYRKFPLAEAEDYQDMAMDLYVDTPKKFLDKIKKMGYAGFASYGGDYVVVYDKNLLTSLGYSKLP